MKKILLLASFFIAITTFAQTTANSKKKEMIGLKEDKANLKADRKTRNTEIAHGKTHAAKKMQTRIKRERKYKNSEKKDLKNVGVKNPEKQATKQ
jgi:hypothetical protein